jgi:hypothetical protein
VVRSLRLSRANAKQRAADHTRFLAVMPVINDIERAQLMDVLDRATAKLEAGEAGPDPEWIALVAGVLDLPPEYLPAVQVTLAQRRWPKANDPKAYIRKVARREMLNVRSGRDPKSTLVIPNGVRDEEGQPLSYQDYIDYRSYDYDPVKKGTAWQARNPSDEPIWADEEGRQIPVVNGRPVPEDLLMLEDDGPDAKLVINWPRVAERAGLDAQVAQVLKFRGAGVTREAMLNMGAKNEDERRALQAAWRRLDRHMDAVRAVLAGAKKDSDTV